MNPPSTQPTRSAWQLPLGVTQGEWQYSQERFIADDYDAYFADHGLLQLDQNIIDAHFRVPGTVVDLGCGTGRALLPLVRRGFRGVAVDLSPSMLDVVMRKAAAEALPVHCVRGNLVELDFLADRMADYAICLFSTLGMIAGHQHRQTVMNHIRRILKPGGLLVLHVHNYWHNVWMPDGRRWVMGNLLRSMLGREPRGDKRYEYRSIRNFYLHVFTYRELTRLIRRAGLELVERNLVGPYGDRLLDHPWFAGPWRAQGWIVVCRTPSTSASILAN